MRHVFFVALFLLALMPAAYSQSVDKELLPATETRHIQLGDKWVYHVTRKYPVTREVRLGNANIPYHSSVTAFSGTMTVLVVAVPKDNGPTSLAFRQTTVYRLAHEDVDKTWLVYFDQDEDQAIQIVAEQPEKKDVVHNLCVPGHWSDGLAFQSVPFFGIANYAEAGSDLVPRVVFANTIAGAEKISVKAGQFIAWKVSRASNEGFDDSTITSQNVWFAPEVCLPIKIVSSIAVHTVGGYNGKATEAWELISTNVKSKEATKK